MKFWWKKKNKQDKRMNKTRIRVKKNKKDKYLF